MKTIYVQEIYGRMNKSGQPAECLRCVSFEGTLDLLGAVMANPPGLKPHFLRFKLPAWSTVANHQAGKCDDPGAAMELDIDMSQYPEVTAKFEEAFALLNPIVASVIGATIKTVEFEEAVTECLGLNVTP